MDRLFIDAGAAAAVLVALFTILGVLWKFVLLPNLQLQLFEPIRETHRQVTENGGRNELPTLPDKLHALQDSVDALHLRDDEIAKAVEICQTTQKAVVLVLDEHLRRHE